MKTIINIILISALALRVDILNAQTVNWAVQNGSYKNMFSASLSLNYGFVYGISYGHQFSTKVFPFIASIEYSAPTGNDIFDDFKVETGINLRWIQLGHFQFSTKINGIFRRYENDFVRLLNFGSNLSGIFGYYRSRWFAACEIGFDKAIVTHFKHSETYKDINPAVANGWFEPSTGGNFYYGMQTGLSFIKTDINLRIGKILTQDFKTTPMIPYCMQLGLNWRF